MAQTHFDPNRVTPYSREELLRLYQQEISHGRTSLSQNQLETGRQHLATAEQIRFRFTSEHGRMPSDLVVRL
jgi:hypothetical protein